ncbi:MAG: hypothetical protein JO262_21205 [Solirubrobacterales bacterium]|nr:hypothetical protein [Solirubrobacterales bacterium]
MIGRKALIALAAAVVVAALPASSGAQPPPCTSTVCGTTTDGGQWIADFPSPISSWNGTLLLYSHGFGPPVAADAPDPNTKAALLARGYALAGSSYDPNGSWWALDSALSDQFQTLTAVEKLLPRAPTHVFAVGTSMGGLISALEDEHSRGRLQAALTTCGIVAGAVQLNNYQLDGEYAMSQLLGAGQNLKLVGYSSPGDGLTTAYALDALAEQAQSTAAGRARLALAMSLMNVATWPVGQPMPAPRDYGAQEQGQYAIEFGNKAGGTSPIQTTMDFVEFGRYYIELADGGNAAWTKNVNFGRLLAESPYAPEIISLYRQAGLNLRADLENLTRNANITADPAAVRSLTQTSVPTGRLQVPELDMHTISDQLVPVQQENYYRHMVAFADRSDLLRQAFVERQLHCNFTPSELVAGVQAIQQRVQTGHWDHLADPSALNAAANATGLGAFGAPAFIPYEPARLSGDNGPFDPFTGGSFPFPFGRW